MDCFRKKFESWSVKLRLLVAGWYPGRNVLHKLKIPNYPQQFPEAMQVLAEYGGLCFGNSNSYIKLDPVFSDNVDKQIEAFAQKLGRNLYPLGVMVHQDTHFLLIDNEGIIYTMIDCPIIENDIVHTIFELEPLASSFTQAIGYFVFRSSNRKKMKNDLKNINMDNKMWKVEEYVALNKNTSEHQIE